MAKKVLATTDIRHNGETYLNGTELDTSLFTKVQLRELHDAGAIEVVDIPEAEKAEKPVGPDVETVGTSGEDANNDLKK